MEQAPEVTIEEREPTQEELDYAAAKQLMVELGMIKRRIYDSGTLINGVLIVQVKGMIASLMRKYNEVGMLQGESVTLKMSDYSKHASLTFKYSPKLDVLMAQISKESMDRALAEMKKVNSQIEEIAQPKSKPISEYPELQAAVKQGIENGTLQIS